MDKKKENGEIPKSPSTRREKRSRTEMEAAMAANSGTSDVNASSAIVSAPPASGSPVPPLSSNGGNFAVISNPFTNGFFPQGSKLVGVSKSGKKYVFSHSGSESLGSSKNSPPPPPVPIPDESLWRKVMPHLPRCTSAEGIRASSYYSTGKTPPSSSTSRNNCLRRLLQELVALEEDLPSTMPNIWLRYDEETPQYLRCLITAPQGTPYALGLFAFDIWIPDSYPSQPPHMQLLTTGGGTVRFSPNLYQNGKVCLSLLGTWSGPKWNPLHSSLLQVLMSIQGLILGFEHPYYLEPGHGGWEGDVKSAAATSATAVAATTTTTSASKTKNPAPAVATATKGSQSTTKASAETKAAPAQGEESEKKSGTLYATIPVVDSTQPFHVQTYEDGLRFGTIKYAMLDMLKNAKNEQLAPRHYLHPFKDIILCHFYHCKNSIIPTVSIFASAAKSSSQRRTAKAAADELEKELTDMTKPTVIAIAEEASDGVEANEDTKTSAVAIGGPKNGSVIGSIIGAKRKGLEEAVARQDYVAAGRLQTELHHLGDAATGPHCSIEQRITSKEQEMDAAAAVKDYISAGKLQASLQRLKKNKKVLQNLEARMFDAASKLDFVRAGRFQEQFQVLLQHSETNTGNTLGKSLGADSSYGKNKASMSGPFASVAEAAASASKFLGSPSSKIPSGMPAPVLFGSFGPPPLSASLPPPPGDDGFYDDGYAYMDDAYYGDY